MPSQLITREQAANNISEELFPVTKRVFATWPEITVHVMGRYCLVDAKQSMDIARARLKNAPAIKQSQYALNKKTAT